MRPNNGSLLLFLLMLAMASSVYGAAEPEPAADALTLQECIDLAFANNPDVAARGWETAQAQAQRDAAAGHLVAAHGIVSRWHRNDGYRPNFLGRQRHYTGDGQNHGSA